MKRCHIRCIYYNLFIIFIIRLLLLIITLIYRLKLFRYSMTMQEFVLQYDNICETAKHVNICPCVSPYLSKSIFTKKLSTDDINSLFNYFRLNACAFCKIIFSVTYIKHIVYNVYNITT